MEEQNLQQDFKKEDILKQTVQVDREDKTKKRKTSALGVILTIILTITLIILGERILFDLNKNINPHVQAAQKETSVNVSKMNYSLSSERNILSQSTIKYKTSEKNDYLNYKTLIHAGFIIPVFLLVFLFYYLFNIKKKNSNLRVVIHGYLFFSIWMIGHFIIDIIRLAYREFPSLALYFLLILFAAIFTGAAIFIQKKVSQHNE